MLNRERSEAVLSELENERVGLPTHEPFRTAWARGETFLLRASSLSVIPRNFRRLAQTKGGEFFGFTAYDLRSELTILEKRPNAVYWIIDNFDASFSTADLKASLERHFKQSFIHLLAYDDLGQFQVHKKCYMPADISAPAEDIVAFATRAVKSFEAVEDESRS